jgi:REP element-mobilizing transposase RayT
MPREPRNIQPGSVYHLISRFVDREWFIQKQEERDLYLRLLGRAAEHTQWRLLSYAVMSNHIHLGAIAGADPLHAWIRRVHAPFADSMNRAYDRIGVMFVRGPKAYLVEPSDVGNLIAYIHNNPVRAGVVQRAEQSTWTSHAAFIGQAPRPRWLHVDETLACVGITDRRAFNDWVADPERKSVEHAFTEDAHQRELERIRQRTELSKALHKPLPAEVVSAAAEAVGISVRQLCSRARGNQEVLARTVAVHCAATRGFTGPEIANALHMSQQGVSVIRRRAPTAFALELVNRAAALLDESSWRADK